MRHPNRREQVLELSKVEANKDLLGLYVASTVHLSRRILLFFVLFHLKIEARFLCFFSKKVFISVIFPLNYLLKT